MKLRVVLISFLTVFIVGLLIPSKPLIPVVNATKSDWNKQSFWYEPWGVSGVHKGIDIFAKNGQPVISSTPGLVIYRGNYGIGGKVVAVLGPKWRIHYYAHLDQIAQGSVFVSAGEVVGSVGTSGNAVGKPPHLHYAVISIVPIPWLYSDDTQGWKKMFFINPIEGI